jgi:DNA-binding transcriptional MerR regulator/effector-binding domain-containing protein
MRRDQLYSIGQAARICDISIQTLRYYDKIGLVKPEHVEEHSGYRFYANRGLLQIKIVQDMKAMNFSLEEIADALRDGRTDRMKANYTAKHAELLRQQEELKQAQATVERRLQQLQYLQQLESGLEELDVLIELKRLPDRRVAFDRGIHACDMESLTGRFVNLFRSMEENGMAPGGYCMSVYHESIMTFDRDSSDLEVCIPLADSFGGQGDSTNIRVIAGGEHITALYCGVPNERSCKYVYGRLQEWIGENGYCESGPAIEQYLVDLAQMTDPANFIVELQLPVTKLLTL